jgi:hypothetical protein
LYLSKITLYFVDYLSRITTMNLSKQPRILMHALGIEQGSFVPVPVGAPDSNYRYVAGCITELVGYPLADDSAVHFGSETDTWPLSGQSNVDRGTSLGSLLVMGAERAEGINYERRASNDLSARHPDLWAVTDWVDESSYVVDGQETAVSMRLEWNLPSMFKSGVNFYLQTRSVDVHPPSAVEKVVDHYLLVGRAEGARKLSHDNITLDEATTIKLAGHPRPRLMHDFSVDDEYKEPMYSIDAIAAILAARQAPERVSDPTTR